MEERRGILSWFRRQDTDKAQEVSVGQPAGRISVVEAVKAKAIQIAKVGYSYAKGTKNRESFEGPEGFSFTEIERAWISDSYVRQAVDRHVDFMFKAGWEFVGKNQAAVDYIRARFRAMAFASGTPTDTLFHQIAENSVKFHNAFVIKARQPGSYQYPQGLKVTPFLSSKPVAGYFCLPVSTITVTRTETGEIKKYKQDMKGTGSSATSPLEIKPEDMIHLAIDRLDGRAFGFPFLASALSDVMLLRQIEELVDRTIYKNVFPLVHYQVGSKEIPADDDEIAAVKTSLASLTLDGAVITSERHNIKMVGAEGEMLNVEGYMKYFKTRVFTALGVSSTIMGESETANKSTSDNLDQMFKDRVKGYQHEIEQMITYQMIYELLTEGGFDPIINQDDMVEFRFQEIDLAAKMAEQNHIVQLFTQNSITHEEMRTLLKMDAVADEDRLYFNMITIPVGAAGKEAQASLSAGNNAGANKNQPTNQHGKKSSSESKNSSDLVQNGFKNRYYSFVKIFSGTTGTVSKETIAIHASLFREEATRLLLEELDSELQAGIGKVLSQTGRSVVGTDALISSARFVLKSKIEGVLNRFTGDIVRQFESPKTPGETITILEAMQFRIVSILKTESVYAYNLGFRHAATHAGLKKAMVSSSEYQCERCGTGTSEFDLETGELPPHHPNCTCRLTF